MAGQTASRRLTVVMLLLSSLVTALGLSGQVDTKISARDEDVAELFSGIVSPETARAAAQDQILRRHVEDAVDLVADLSRMLAKRFDNVPELQQASRSLEKYRESLSGSPSGTKTRRQDLLGGLGGLLGGGSPTAPATPGATESGAVAGGGLLSGLTGGISSALSGLGNSLLQDAGGASMFLGIGLGAGAAQGLNVAPAPMTQQVAAKVAADNGMNATGLNPALQNAAMGATASLLGSVNISSLASSAGGSLDLNGLALGAANGIGNGISSGLKLSPQAMAMEPPKGNSTADIANTFGFGLTKSLASNVDPSKLSASSINISQFTGGVPTSQIAMSLAQGIGNGASSGLKLTQAALAPPTGNTASDALGAFGFGLTNSLTSNLNTSSLTSGGGALSNININQIIPNLGMTAMSFGTGLGSGAAAGLKLSSAVVNAPDPNGNDAPSVAGNFAFGLTKSVTENVNLSQLASPNSPLAGAAGSIDIGRAAQGVAMGLVQGAGDAVNSMGGLQALINGTATMPQGGGAAIQPNSLAFNDSVGGAAMGLGTGLGGQGTLVGVQLLSQLNVTSLVEGLVGNNTGSGGAAAAPGNGTAVARRSVRQVLSSAVLPRQESGVTTVSNGNSFNLSVVFNADTISSVSQRVVSALTCEGVGGLVLVALGLLNSGTISTNGVSSGVNVTTLQQVVPKGLIKITSDGNTFAIDGQKVIDNLQGNLLSAADGITINGNTAIKFAAFLAIHIMVAMTVFLAVLPLILSLEGTRALLLRLKLDHVLPKASKWAGIGWFWVMGPATLITLIFGVLTVGNSGNMRTTHGILGLITALFTLGATGFQIFNKLYISTKAPSPDSQASVLPVPFALFDRRTISTLLNQLLLTLTMPTLISGFADLGSVTLCATRALPFEAAFAIAVGLTALYTTGSGISLLNIMLAVLDIRRAKKEAADRRDEENWGNKSLKEKIQYVGQDSRVKMDGRPETLVK